MQIRRYRNPRLGFVLGFVLLFGIASPAVAAPSFSQMVVFGDSLSDRRNVHDISRDASLTLVSIPDAPYANGRFSNGELWVERLSTHLGLGSVTASRDGGRDFAHGSVLTGDGNFVLATILGFIDITAPNIGQQVLDWTSSNNANSSQLFTVLGGGNDILSNLNGVNAQTMANNMVTNVQRLYNDGARHVLVANLPDMGKVPRYVGTADAAQATLRSTSYNSALSAGLNALEQSSPGLNLYHVDTFALFNMVIANPVAYGFTNATDAAYIGDPDYDGGGTLVGDPSTYVFFDNIHPTAKAHALLGDAAFAAIPEPSVIVLFAVGLSLAGQRRIRRAA